MLPNKCWLMLTPDQGNVVLITDEKEAQRFMMMGDRQVVEMHQATPMPRELLFTDQDYFDSIVKNTVGYAESENKVEFMKGARVAWAKIIHSPDVTAITARAEYAEREAKDLRDDLNTLAYYF